MAAYTFKLLAIAEKHVWLFDHEIYIDALENALLVDARETCSYLADIEDAARCNNRLRYSRDRVESSGTSAGGRHASLICKPNPTPPNPPMVHDKCSRARQAIDRVYVGNFAGELFNQQGHLGAGVCTRGERNDP